jgi:hypothetical protein
LFGGNGWTRSIEHFAQQLPYNCSIVTSCLVVMKKPLLFSSEIQAHTHKIHHFLLLRKQAQNSNNSIPDIISSEESYNRPFAFAIVAMDVS